MCITYQPPLICPGIQVIFLLNGVKVRMKPTYWQKRMDIRQQLEKTNILQRHFTTAVALNLPLHFLLNSNLKCKVEIQAVVSPTLERETVSETLCIYLPGLMFESLGCVEGERGVKCMFTP
jgi:hypothetical protein